MADEKETKKIEEKIIMPAHDLEKYLLKHPLRGEIVIAVEKGKSTRKDIKLGICGEHGGEPSSIEFCHKIGLNYVSCSPYRVPIARLAAAQAVLKEKQ